MNKEKINMKLTVKVLAIAVLFLILGNVISKVLGYSLKDVLFIEGIILMLCGILSSIKGNPKGLSMQGLGSMNAQYISNANLEITKREREKIDMKEEVRFAFSGVVLITSGIICVVMNYII